MFKEAKKIEKSAKITAGKFAFGETTCARPIASKLAWRSLNRGLGGFENFATSFLPSLLETETSATAPAGGGATTSGFPCRQGAGSLMRYVYNIMYNK